MLGGVFNKCYLHKPSSAALIVFIQINAAFLTYQSREGAQGLFPALGDPSPIFETFSGDAPLSITFSEPDDQVRCDWWTDTISYSPLIGPGVRPDHLPPDPGRGRLRGARRGLGPGAPPGAPRAAVRQVHQQSVRQGRHLAMLFEMESSIVNTHLNKLSPDDIRTLFP